MPRKGDQRWSTKTIIEIKKIKKPECAEYFYLLDNVQSNPHCCKYSPCLNLFTTKAVCQVLVQIRGFCRWKSFLKDNKGKCATTPCSAWCSAPKIFLRIFCSKPKYLTIFLFIILKNHAVHQKYCRIIVSIFLTSAPKR